MNTTTSTGYRYTDEERTIAHADHTWEQWNAHLSCEDEIELNGDESGICCHTCRVIVIDNPDSLAQLSDEQLEEKRELHWTNHQQIIRGKSNKAIDNSWKLHDAIRDEIARRKTTNKGV